MKKRDRLRSDSLLRGFFAKSQCRSDPKNIIFRFVKVKSAPFWSNEDSMWIGFECFALTRYVWRQGDWQQSWLAANLCHRTGADPCALYNAASFGHEKIVLYTGRLSNDFIESVRKHLMILYIGTYLQKVESVVGLHKIFFWEACFYAICILLNRCLTL